MIEIGTFTRLRAQAWTFEDVQRWREAAGTFWLAAFVAPTPRTEESMLRRSWICYERAAGRRSELETRA